MSAEGVDLARTLRERRRALGLTRSRLADTTGITTVDLTRWERGESLPSADAVIVLAEAIGLDVAETQAWLDQVPAVDLTGPNVAVELVESDEPPSDPFLNRSALLKAEPRLLERIADRLARRDERRVGSDKDASVTPIRAPKPELRRPAPNTVVGLVREPRPMASQLPSVFPDPPIASYDPATHVYSTAATAFPTDADDQFYLLRRIRTAAVLIGLGVALWWALGSLWEGFGDVFELFSTPTTGG